MAGERSLEGVLAGSGSGAGTPGLLGLLLDQARVPVLVIAAVVLAATATLILRRRRPA